MPVDKRPAVDQLQLALFARLEQRRSAAENDRVQRDAELVDQSVRDQAVGEVGAAEQKNILGAVAFQPGDGLGDVGAEHLRVVPVGFLHRAGEDVFRRGIHEIGDLAGRARPVICHQFVGDTAEQQSAGGVQLLDRQLLQFLAPDVEMPGNIPVRTFDETIQRHQIPHDQPGHRSTLLKPIAICNWLYPEITDAILQAVF